jgi:hypothetical protein
MPLLLVHDSRELEPWTCDTKSAILVGAVRVGVVITGGRLFSNEVGIVISTQKFIDFGCSHETVVLTLMVLMLALNFLNSMTVLPVSIPSESVYGPYEPNLM